MKKLAPILVILLLVAIIVVITISRAKQQQTLTVYEGNLQRIPLEIKLGQYQDTQCGMALEKVEDSAQAVAPDGKTWFFDDVGCLALWLQDNSIRDEMVLWVYSRDTKEWIDGRKAWYAVDANTVMHYGFAAFKEKQEGFIDFKEMTLRMLRGENMTNPYIRKQLLGDH